MSFVCELSGEPLTGVSDVVVTPSGHVCLKRLILTKLAENGGVDPWSTGPLQESELVTMASTSKILPPRPHMNSLPNLLQLMQSEYDNLVLELFDTRKALEETRKELSLALYQNDAAIRVVARITMERDQAREELEQWNAADKATTVATMTTTTNVATDGDSATEPPAKKQKTLVVPETTITPVTGSIPKDHLILLTETWEKLSQDRKAQKKQLAAAAPSKDVVSKFAELQHKGWHKSSGKQGLLAMAQDGDLVTTTGRDKQICVYDMKEGVLSFTVAGVGATTIDLQGTRVVAGVNKTVKLFDKEEEIASLELASDVVQVQFHPSGQHIVVLLKESKLILCDATLNEVASFENAGSTYTAGKLHPDGLLFAAGTDSGDLQLWDFKSGSLAITLKSDNDDSAVMDVSFSNNGYHFASVTSAGKVHAWDLKKQKTMAVLEEIQAKMACFDVSGKYLAYAGEKGVVVTTVKEWDVVVQWAKKTSALVWTTQSLITCSDKERAVRFHGYGGDDVEEK